MARIGEDAAHVAELDQAALQRALDTGIQFIAG
jgi:hypothetical protein